MGVKDRRQREDHKSCDYKMNKKKDSNIRQYRFIYFALNSTLHGALLFCYLESAKRFLQQKYFIVLLKIILKCPLSNF